MSPPLKQWVDEDTKLVHLAEEDQGWMAMYCTWRTLEQYHELASSIAPTCFPCLARALVDGRHWDGTTP